MVNLIDPATVSSDNLKMIQQEKQNIDRAIQIYQRGGWEEIYGQRLNELEMMYKNGIISLLPVFTMFLAGLYAGKMGWFQRIADHLHTFRKAQLWGLGIGLPLSILFWVSGQKLDPAIPDLWFVMNYICIAVGTPALCIFYISTIVMWHHHKPHYRFWNLVAGVGRMALSHYIGQSILCTTLFYGYGLGLYGKVSPFIGVVMTVVIYMLQLGITIWWLRQYRYGPLEWIWRSLTYLQLQPFKK